MNKIKKSAIFIVFTLITSCIITISYKTITIKNQTLTLLEAYEIQRGFTGLHFNSIDIAPVIINLLERDKNAFVGSLIIDVYGGQQFEHTTVSDKMEFQGLLINKVAINLEIPKTFKLNLVIYISLISFLWNVLLILCFLSSIAYLLLVLMNRNELLRNKKNIESLNELSLQVAHDIQSPLAALSIVMDDLKELPEDSRDLTLRAIDRIQNIANNLSKNGDPKIEKNITIDCLPSIVLSNIVNEKKIEYQNLGELKIELIDQSSRCNFIKINKGDFGRTISNILNNSVEALKPKGTIKVIINELPTGIIITIQDNGPGFPQEILNNPILRGKSLGKQNGQGLGLFHAKETILKNGGELLLSNNIGDDSSGAKIEIRIPTSAKPIWFRDNIQLSFANKVYIIDDDQTIHDVWKRMIKKMKKSVEIVNAFSEVEIKNLLSKVTTDDVVLIDYDLHQSKNGIDYIKEFRPKNIILVTSSYDVKQVTDYCSEQNIQIIPKQIMTSITIN